MSRFVYGSLMAPEVLAALLGRVPARVPATARGYRRFAIRDRVYPAVVPEPGASVDGEILSGMTDRELAVLDWFEDEAYVPTALTAETFAGEALEVVAYVFDDRAQLAGDWSYDAFRSAHLDAYVEMCEAFAEDVRENDLPGPTEADAEEGVEERESR